MTANKVVKFSEPLYGKDGESQIVTDGKRLALVLLNPPADVDEKDVMYIRRKMAGSFSGSDVNTKIDGILSRQKQDIVGLHSGASWSAVLWSCASLLNGYTIDVNGTLVSLD